MKYLILGAGPAGLTFANRLVKSGETSFFALGERNGGWGKHQHYNSDVTVNLALKKAEILSNEYLHKG